MDDVVDCLDDAVCVDLGFAQAQLLPVFVLRAEETLACAEKYRKYEEVVAVDEIGVGECACEFGAAVNEDRTAFGLLERRNVID
ncbi:hypothetical protein BJ994_002766 [Arthrobacter pigmenti]|uniref:Uncharacterized protein n=1 Tax=Arthrobacter pigmenti TaxID=271432 RepID=A0A846RQ52_9MICC|nr:hypothetical protein [Arthrobacter pigmenti]